jgi:hypothetical protein
MLEAIIPRYIPMSLFRTRDAPTRHPPESDEDLLDSIWEGLWAFAQLHYPVSGRGLITLDLRESDLRMHYRPLAECGIPYPTVLPQEQEYCPPTECVVLLSRRRRQNRRAPVSPTGPTWRSRASRY